MYLPKVYKNFQDHFPEVFKDFKQRRKDHQYRHENPDPAAQKEGRGPSAGSVGCGVHGAVRHERERRAMEILKLVRWLL